MDNADALLLIRALSGQGNTLTIPRVYADFMGSVEGGLFLNQLIFWSDKGKRADGYIWKKRTEWSEETMLTDYAIRKHTSRLVCDGYLETTVKRAMGAPTVHYRLHLLELAEAIVRFARGTNGSVEINESEPAKSTEHGSVEINESLTDDYQTTTQHGDGVVHLLESIGVESAVAEQLADKPAVDIRGWVEYVQAGQGLTNPAGLVVKRLKAGIPPPQLKVSTAWINCRCGHQRPANDQCGVCGMCYGCCECEG